AAIFSDVIASAASFTVVIAPASILSAVIAFAAILFDSTALAAIARAGTAPSTNTSGVTDFRHTGRAIYMYPPVEAVGTRISHVAVTAPSGTTSVPDTSCHPEPVGVNVGENV